MKAFTGSMNVKTRFSPQQGIGGRNNGWKPSLSSCSDTFIGERPFSASGKWPSHDKEQGDELEKQDWENPKSEKIG